MTHSAPSWRALNISALWRQLLRCALLAACLLTLPQSAAAQDLIEFLSGAKAEGKVTQIDTEKKVVSFEAVIAGKPFQRTYPYNRIHAVTYKGKRYVLNPRDSAAVTPAPRTANGGAAARETPAPASGGRTASDLKSVITQAGTTLPDWYDATPLEYPQSLDLSWPEKPEGAWNNQKNVGQYVWDVINPNPGRWRSGIRLMDHLLTLEPANSARKQRIQAEIGRMYFELLQDYPRAAWWYQQAGVGSGGRFDSGKNAAHLAECYWRLGNRKQATDLMNKLPLSYALIKLWGDIGDTEKCVQLAVATAKNSQFPAMNYLIVGDAHRTAGDFGKALTAYKKAEELAKQPPSHARQEGFRVRALANIKALEALAKIDLKRTPDGAYREQSIGYEGPVEVEVRVVGGRIEEVRVTQHKEKQFYSSIEDTTAKIVAKQGIQGVDATSGATITSEAIINASAKALAGALP